MLRRRPGTEDFFRDAVERGDCAAPCGKSRHQFFRNSPTYGGVVVRCGPYRQGEAMTHARYFVVQHGDVWMIKFDDEEYGPYKSKNEAMLFAIDAAQKLGEHGEDAEVLLMGENNHVRPEWVFGRDPYPPQLSGL
jgi:hypothetical protein